MVVLSEEVAAADLVGGGITDLHTHTNTIYSGLVVSPLTGELDIPAGYSAIGVGCFAITATKLLKIGEGSVFVIL